MGFFTEILTNIIPLSEIASFFCNLTMFLRKFTPFLVCFSAVFVQIPDISAQPMLGYTDQQGDFYVQDSGRVVHLEHLPIRNIQPAANSLAYISNSGELTYYANHNKRELKITNPAFYRNTDYYLFYSDGTGFSVFDGIERKKLGFIQQYPYAFGDSIAAVHDYAAFFYVYSDGLFLELEKQPVLKIVAGDNIIAYVNHLGQLRTYIHGEQSDLDTYAPISLQAGANTVAWIDQYNYLKVFNNNEITELTHLSNINCLSTNMESDPLLEVWCNGPVVVDVQTQLPVYQTGDDIVAYIDDTGDFFVFSDGNVVSLEDTPPTEYHVVDNLLWYVDGNGFLKVFNNGELHLVETYTPTNIQADRNVFAYTDLDRRLKVFYKGERIAVSDNMILSYTLNNTLLMYSEAPNKYKFRQLD